MLKKKAAVFFALAMVFVHVHLFAQSNDEAEVHKVVNRFYSVLCFSDSSAVKLDELPILFTKEGKLIAAFGQDITSWTASEFVTYLHKSISTQGITARTEKEVYAKMEWFGHIAHVFSTYELTMQVQGQTIIRRGINSIQLVKENESWKIISLTWDRESDVNKLPSKYLHD